MKHRFQRYIVRTEIFSTFHARVEYICQHSAHSNQWDWVCTDIQKWKHNLRQFHSVQLADIISLPYVLITIRWKVHPSQFPMYTTHIIFTDVVAEMTFKVTLLLEMTLSVYSFLYNLSLYCNPQFCAISGVFFCSWRCLRDCIIDCEHTFSSSKTAEITANAWIRPFPFRI